MTRRVDLPSGAWVALKETRHVTIRERRPVLAAISKVITSQNDLELLDDTTVAAAVAMIAQWSHPVPVTADEVMDRVTQEDLDVLQPILFAAVAELQPKFTEPDVDPASPTNG